MERRNLIYGLVLGVLGIALVVVVVLVLRKQAALPQIAPVANTSVPNVNTGAPAATKPLKSYVPERPYQAGDPIPQTFGTSGGFDASSTQP